MLVDDAPTGLPYNRRRYVEDGEAWFRALYVFVGRVTSVLVRLFFLVIQYTVAIRAAEKS